MPASPSAEPPDAGGIRVGDVGGNVSFRALGDIVGGDKITTIATTIQISVEAVTQRELIPGSPYRGLDRFEDRDAALFFGRDQLIKNLLAQLSASNVLLVLGASGSGKSSVVRAGLLPRLSQLIGARFRYLILVPDVNPSESLRSALQASGFSQAQTRELLDAQPDVPRRLIRQLQREGDQWLLFVDQFEEIFTRSEERLRSGFIAALLKIAQDPAGSIKLVLAMRGDFLDCFTPFPEFAKLVEKNIVLVTDMHVDELRLAIEQPAAKHGIVFRPGLVEEIIKDVQGQAGSLPLLQYTLNQLWQEEARGDGLADRHLEKETYRQLGGVRGALQKRADEIYASFGNGPDSKSESAKQKIVRQIFLRVVDLAGKDSDEAGWRAVRQRVRKALFKNPEEQQVLQKLIDEKLLVSSGRQGVDATVEVAHEALFTSWGRLKEWIEGGKQVIFARNRLADDARRWQSHRLEDRAGAEEELLSGSRLGQALEMRARGDFDTILGGLPETEAQFLDASAALHERRRQEEQERQQRELVQAQALAKEQKQRADDQAKAAARQRRLTMAMVVLFLAAAAAAVFSLVQTNVAHKAEAKAKDTFVQSDFDTALLEQQNSKAVSVPALAHLARALRTSGEARLPRQYLVSLLRDSPWCLPQTEPLRHEDLVWAASFSPDGQRVVTASKDGTARVWDAQSGKPVGEPLRHEDLVRAASFSPDGQRVVTASHDGTARVWDAQSGKPLGEPLRHEDWVRAASFSPDGRRVVTASRDGTARVWDAQSGKPVGQPLRHEAAVWAASFSPDGQRIVTASDDRTARVWDAQSGKPVGQPLRHESPVASASFSADGQRVVTASRDTTARVWDAQTGEPIGESLRHKDEVPRASFSPDGQRVVTASYDKTARVWDAQSGRPVGEPLRHEEYVMAASFSADGQRVVTASVDRTARVWDAQTGKPVGEPLRHEGQVSMANFSADGQRIVTASHDNTAQVWDAESGRPVGEPLRHEDLVTVASFSPDGQRIVTASHDNTAQVWDAESGRPVGEPLRHEGWVSAASFSPDGQRIVTASRDRTARVWDAQSGKLVGEPLHHEGEVMAASFSSDGQRVVTASYDNTAQVWDAQSGKPVGEPLHHEDGVSAASFSPDRRRVVTASRDNTARVWDAQSGKLVGEPLHHENLVSAASFSADGRRIVTASHDKTARVWDAQSGKPVGEPLRHESEVMAASFSKDGQRVVTASDNTARLWDVQSGKPVGEPLRHQDLVWAASFSADGWRVVTASRDGTARVWDAQSGRPMGEPLRHKRWVEAASFSPDGRRIVTASWDKTARVWDVAVDLESPLPAWVPDLAEALGGRRLNENGLLVPTKKSIVELRTELLALKGDDFWSRFGRWFFMRGPNRTISPDSKITVGELGLFRAKAREEKGVEPRNQAPTEGERSPR